MTIEAVNPLTLPSLSLQERRSLPECAAVYFVLNSSSEILYIGRANNLAQRWLAHHRWTQLTAMGDGIRIAWLECSDPVLLPIIEIALIRHFQPILNNSPIPNVENGKGRIAVTLEPEIYQRIVERAAKEGRSLANLAAFLLSGTVKEQMEQEATKDKDAA
ncbi:hypothetical protein VF14_35065 [Nostoc linckia z18]|uniref:GIY-YIG domain-containing protein n=2 Tax=Nostoc linckia TaxID=92942 RepID=A0A9Q5Z4M5_NOSLI|nr:GIY-YIG nuclease family protein [Nostoc linckia]PHJ56373.1 hypothetical protein VF05_37295 [Nostoc linckia z3]PHJ56738.1 hypothetical protein VF03_37270 [Nostoc linckia z2]PHJ71228.1 hypothetical protein VF06_37310 [Nostoc linckia z4]PHJ75610.1 hypothetical protein VF07_37320 [Nostoc linckia z6]PHJ84980.1 hypothetical protein VF04_35920 [Nostoc linckia z7]